MLAYLLMMATTVYTTGLEQYVLACDLKVIEYCQIIIRLNFSVNLFTIFVDFIRNVRVTLENFKSTLPLCS